MKVFSAKYDPSYNTADNSLVNNMLKYPEIAKKIIELYPRYSMTYLLERLGFGASEKVIGANAFEWKIMGRYKKPAVIADSDDATNRAVGAEITVNVKTDRSSTNDFHCHLHAGDIVKLDITGGVARVVSVGSEVTTSGGTCPVTLKVIKGYSASLVQNGVLGVIGSAFGQGSLGDEVGELYAYPETHRNHLTLSRRKCKINGIDLHDVTWVEHNGHRLWYFTKEQQLTDQFMYELELNRWFGKSSINDSLTFPGDAGSVASGLDSSVPVMGDGILAQIDASHQFTYTMSGSTDLTEATLLETIATLSLNTLSPTGNEFVCFTGMQGMVQFQKAMRAFIGQTGATNGGVVMVDKAGQDVEVGANFTSYNVLGNKISIVHNPCFDDPNMGNISLSSGLMDSQAGGQLSGLMVFMDMSTQDGVANVELIAKGAEGYNRNYVKKYVAGMINPNDPTSMMAANGNDTFECHILSESGVIVRNPLSCGILKPTGLVI